MTALIDADSLVYIIAWNYREGGTEEEVKASCDTFLKDILTITQSDDYIGVFSGKSDETFRATEYKYAKYKGNRPDKPDCMVQWENTIKTHFIVKHGFISNPQLEADDIISAIANLWNASFAMDPNIEMMESPVPHVICSPDKDLRQVPGYHYDYRAKLDPEMLMAPIVKVSTNEAFWNFWTQMLMGDDTDNVAGIPGLGPVKAKKIIDELKCAEHHMATIRPAVLSRYRKYFGDYYGPIIFKETELVIRLMNKAHPLYANYQMAIENYASTARKKLSTTSGFFDITS